MDSFSNILYIVETVARMQFLYFLLPAATNDFIVDASFQGEKSDDHYTTIAHLFECSYSNAGLEKLQQQGIILMSATRK